MPRQWWMPLLIVALTAGCADPTTQAPSTNHLLEESEDDPAEIPLRWKRTEHQSFSGTIAPHAVVPAGESSYGFTADFEVSRPSRTVILVQLDQPPTILYSIYVYSDDQEAPLFSHPYTDREEWVFHLYNATPPYRVEIRPYHVETGFGWTAEVTQSYGDRAD